MDTLNLAERYAAPPIAWSEVTGLVDAGLVAASAHAVQTVEPHGATRWRF